MKKSSFDRLALMLPDPGASKSRGLIASGGNLKPQLLLCAYSRGMFPWYSEGQPILWWSPDPRCILLPSQFRLPHRARRKLAQRSFALSINLAFEEVINACRAPRKNQQGTWITEDIRTAYIELNRLGYAHSVEVWKNGDLVGGLYGVSMGRIFFGESMFHLVSEASRAALNALVCFLKALDFLLIDCQDTSPHMLDMGATTISRLEFLFRLQDALEWRDNLPQNADFCPWLPWMRCGSQKILKKAWRAAVADLQ